MHTDLLAMVLILLALSVGAVALLRRVHLPPVLGYLLVGILAGPHALGWIPASDTLHLLAEIGVVFLLFMIGLEFSLAQFWSLRRAVVGLGGSQVVLTTALAALVAWWAGVPVEGALVLGGALALSSTAIVARQLVEQLEMRSRHGRLALAVLLFQDIAVVPFLVLIPLLGSGEQSGLLVPLVHALGKGALAVTAILAVGHWLVRPVFHTVAASHSEELFTLTALLVALAAAWLTNRLGLSLALGAFLAGMLLSESEFRHQVEIDIRPFRDILMGLFFISVGGELDLAELPGHWREILLVTAGLVLGKGLLVAGITRVMGYEPGVAVRTGMVLANGGEFGFALLTLALAHRLLAPGLAQAVLAAIVLSMLLAPLLVKYNGAVAKRLFTRYLQGRRLPRQRIAEAASQVRRHVLFCGFGRIGQHLAGFLRPEGIDYIAVDSNATLVKEAWEAGEPVFFGDCTHADILEAARLDEARLVVITVDDAHLTERIIRIVRQRYPDLPILVRTRDDRQLEALREAGATLVLPETLEASMMLGQHMLEFLGIDHETAHQVVEQARQDQYRRLRGFFHGDEPESLEEAEAPRLHTVTLAEGDHAVGHRLGELIGRLDGVTVTGLCREGVRGEAPEPDLVLQPGDAVILAGGAEALEHAEGVLRRG